jgi:hypothetical protein
LTIFAGRPRIAIVGIDLVPTVQQLTSDEFVK